MDDVIIKGAGVAGPACARVLQISKLDRVLPDQTPPTHNPYLLSPLFSENIFICGEYRSQPGLQRALKSGHQTGEHLAATTQHQGA